MGNIVKFIRNHWISLGLAVFLCFGAAVVSSAYKQTAAASGRTKIVFWHEMGGPAEVALDQMVTDFNNSQNKYEVVPQYEGSYDEAVQKIIQTHGSKSSPALFQSFDISTAQIMHPQYATPIQKFITKEHYDMSPIAPAAKAFFSNNGKQLSMPFNISQPVMYYNASLLKKYHIPTPSKSPSYSEITKTAKELYQRSHHQVKGMTMEINGWLMEEALANAHQLLVNHQDGHAGAPDKINLNNPTSQKYLKWLQENIHAKDFMNYGSGSNAAANEIAGFMSGKVGIFFNTSAYISQLTVNPKLKLGISYFPHPDGVKRNGVSIGGASLWIGKDKSKNVQNGAFEFIKYALKPEEQAKWQKATGYMAINKNAENTKTLKDLYAKYPEAKVPFEQLSTVKPNNANSGLLMEGMQYTRQLEQTAMEQTYEGANIDSTLNSVNNQMNSNLQRINKANNNFKTVQ